MPIYEKLMGNPFVDAGVCGICEWLGRNVQPEDITKDDLERVVDDYVPLVEQWEKWGSIFTLNSLVTQSSIKKEERMPRFKEMLYAYIEDITELGQVGDCMGCGMREVGTTSLLDRTGIPLTGGKHSNYFPAFSEGAGYCAACSFAIQFLPLALVAIGRTGSTFLMLHSTSWELMRLWTARCIKGVNQQYSQQQTGGCFKPDILYSRNGLFHMVNEMILDLDEMLTDGEIENEDISMEVYAFRNDNQYPDVEVFYVPSMVFQFLQAVKQNPYSEAWHEIVKIGYGSVKSEKDYKKKKNLVYEYLLEERSIRRFFLSRRTQKHRGNWELLSLYLRKVRNMKPERIEKIKQVGDLIAESIRKSGNRGKRQLRAFADANNYAECRSVLLRIFEDRIYQHKEPEPLFSFEDCVEYLFISSDNAQSWSDEFDDSELDEEQKAQLIHSMSDNVTFWRETRDLLLFRIYEKLYSWLPEKEDN